VERKYIEFTPAKYRKFKAAYESAKASGAETFEFEGNDFLVAYAKYVIMYLEQQMGIRNS